MDITPSQTGRTAALHGLGREPARTPAWLNVGVPQPTSDEVRLPATPLPVPPPPPGLRPDITEPTLPGENASVSDPTPMSGSLH